MEQTTQVTIKSKSETHYTLGGYGVLYGGVDLEGETFTKETDFWLDKLSPTPPVLYQHGHDKRAQKHVLGRASVAAQDVGLWVEAQIELADEYADAIRELAESGKLGWSSGAVGHLSAREGKTITVWPIAEFSLTPTPAEPRTLGVRELRSLAESEPAVKAILPEVGEESTADASGGAVKAETIAAVVRDSVEEPTMAEEEKTVTPEIDVAAIAKQVAEKAVTEAIALMRSAPEVEKGINLQYEGKDHPEAKSFGDWCIAVMRKDEKRLTQVYGSQKAALSETSGTTGGYLVPVDYGNELLKVATEGAIVRPRARIIPMSTREFDVPALNYNGSTAGVAPTLGGVRAYWTEEAGPKTETEPTFEMIKLVYHELSGYTIASNIVRQDAGATLSALLMSLFGQAITWYEDWAFLRGTGVGQPLGVYNAPCLVNEVAGATTFVLADASGMLTRFLPSNPNAGVWVAHPGMIPYFVALADAAAMARWDPDVTDAIPMRLFGKPVIFSEKIPIIPQAAGATSVGGVLLADFSYYLIGSRTGIQIDFSEHYKFINNQGTWRFVTHVDGQPWLTQAVYLADGATQRSPFVSVAGA